MTEEEIRLLTKEEEQRLYEIYLEEVRQEGIHGSLRDFVIWMQQR